MIIFTWIDWSFTTIVILYTLLGFVNGFLKGLVSLITWLVAILASLFFTQWLNVNYVSAFFTSSEVSFWISFIIIILLVWSIGRIFYLSLSLINQDKKSISNRIWGSLFNLFKVLLIINLITGMLNYNTYINNANVWKRSVLVPLLVKGSFWIHYNFPFKININNLKSNDSTSKNDQRNIIVKKSGQELKAIG